MRNLNLGGLFIETDTPTVPSSPSIPSISYGACVQN
jgi:hypothetical protein